jgi:hypothetical protein
MERLKFSNNTKIETPTLQRLLEVLLECSVPPTFADDFDIKAWTQKNKKFQQCIKRQSKFGKEDTLEKPEQKEAKSKEKLKHRKEKKNKEEKQRERGTLEEDTNSVRLKFSEATASTEGLPSRIEKHKPLPAFEELKRGKDETDRKEKESSKLKREKERTAEEKGKHSHKDRRAKDSKRSNDKSNKLPSTDYQGKLRRAGSLIISSPQGQQKIGHENTYEGEEANADRKRARRHTNYDQSRSLPFEVGSCDCVIPEERTKRDTNERVPSSDDEDLASVDHHTPSLYNSPPQRARRDQERDDEGRKSSTARSSSTRTPRTFSSCNNTSRFGNLIP